MRYSLPGVLALVFALTACGGGAANNPAPVDNGRGKQQNSAPDNSADNVEDTPEADPNAYRKVEGTTPEGWHSLGKPGRQELYDSGVFKDPGADLEFLSGISTPRAPGPTEGAEEWDQWREHVSAAMLFHAGEPGQDVVEVLKSAGPKLIDGFDASIIEKDGAMGGGASADGRYLYMSFTNKVGTYVVVSVIAEGDNHDKNGQAVIAWAESIKPQS